MLEGGLSHVHYERSLVTRPSIRRAVDRQSGKFDENFGGRADSQDHMTANPILDLSESTCNVDKLNV